MLKKLYEVFTPFGLAAIGFLIGGALLFFWFLWAISQANEERAVRAISRAEWCECAALPRGSQEMEDRRYGCFKELTASGRFRIDPKAGARGYCDNQQDQRSRST